MGLAGAISRTGSAARAISVLARLGGLRERGELQTACRLAEETLDGVRDWAPMINVRIEYARLLAEMGRNADSEREFDECEALVARAHLISSAGYFHLTRGIARLVSQQADGAIADLRRSQDAFTSTERDVTSSRFWRGYLRFTQLERALLRLARPVLIIPIWLLLWLLALSGLAAGAARFGGLTSLFAMHPVIGAYVVPVPYLYLYLCALVLLVLWPFMVFLSVRITTWMIDVAQASFTPPALNRMMLAQTWCNLGFFDEAEENLHRATEMIGFLRYSKSTGILAFIAAKICLARGDQRAAKEHLKSALFALPRRDLQYRPCRELLALLEFDDGHLDEAIRLIGELPCLAPDGSAEARKYRSQAAWMRGRADARAMQWEQAQAHYREAYELADVTNHLRLTIGLNYAGALVMTQRTAKAAATFRALLDSMELQYDLLLTDAARSIFASNTAWMLRIMVRVQLEIGETRDAARTLIRFKARTFVDRFVRPVRTLSPRADEDLATFDARVQETARATLFSGALAATALRSADPASIEDLQSALSRRRLHMRQRMIEEGETRIEGVQFYELEDVQQALGPHEWLLDVHWNDDWIGALAITRDRVIGRAVNRDVIIPLIERMNSEPPAVCGAAVLEQVSAQFAELRGARTLFVAPDGPLARLGTNRLSDTGHVSLVPGAAVLPALRRPVPKVEDNVLLIGSHARGDLPGVRFELAGIASELKESRLRPAPDADAVERLLEPGSWRVIHIASHGWLSGQGTDSALLLDRNGEPWLLSVDDIDAHIKARALLVVLSSCKMGQPASSDNQLGVLGMPSAFLAACGARAVVASVAPVHDAINALVMPAFYRLLVEGYTVADALERAEAEVAQMTDSDLRGLVTSNKWRMSRDIEAACMRSQRPLGEFIQRSTCLIFGDGSLRLYERT